MTKLPFHRPAICVDCGEKVFHGTEDAERKAFFPLDVDSRIYKFNPETQNVKKVEGTAGGAMVLSAHAGRCNDKAELRKLRDENKEMRARLDLYEQGAVPPEREGRDGPTDLASALLEDTGEACSHCPHPLSQHDADGCCSACDCMGF